jgi:hypothetical protein
VARRGTYNRSKLFAKHDHDPSRATNAAVISGSKQAFQSSVPKEELLKFEDVSITRINHAGRMCADLRTQDLRPQALR